MGVYSLFQQFILQCLTKGSIFNGIQLKNKHNLLSQFENYTIPSKIFFYLQNKAPGKAIKSLLKYFLYSKL